MHEQPNLGKRVSVNLCHIAGLRIPIVPLIESFHLEKAVKRVENICILHPYRHICICMHVPAELVHTYLRDYSLTHVHDIERLRMEVG